MSNPRHLLKHTDSETTVLVDLYDSKPNPSAMVILFDDMDVGWVVLFSVPSFFEFKF
jgi:hypothetical protein